MQSPSQAQPDPASCYPAASSYPAALLYQSGSYQSVLTPLLRYGTTPPTPASQFSLLLLLLPHPRRPATPALLLLVDLRQGNGHAHDTRARGAGARWWLVDRLVEIQTLHVKVKVRVRVRVRVKRLLSRASSLSRRSQPNSDTLTWTTIPRKLAGTTLPPEIWRMRPWSTL